MQDELDAKLLAMFAESRQALPGEEFRRALWVRLERARRSRTLRRTGLIAALALTAAWMAPAVLERTAFLISPWGWAGSMIFGLATLLRTGALRRR